MTQDDRFPPPEARYSFDHFEFEWPDYGLLAVLERFHEDHAGLHCEVTITSSMQPALGHLIEGRLNLSAPQTRTQWVNSLKKRDPDVDWYALMEQICTKAKAQYREGDKVLRLSDVPPATDPPWLLHRFLPSDTISMLFGDGGTFKSMFALAVCLSVCTGREVLPQIPLVGPPRPCLYLDWEWQPEVHSERLRALCAALGMDMPNNLFYRHEIASLPESAAGIRRRIEECGAQFVVVDSLGFARGADPNSAEMTIKAFSAISSFRVPVLVLDHVSKDHRHAVDEATGSIYTRNSVRMQWGLKLITREETDDLTSFAKVKMTDQKSNNRWLGEKGFSLTIRNNESDRMESVLIQQVDTETLHEPQEVRGELTIKVLDALEQFKGKQANYRDIADKIGETNLKNLNSLISGTMREKGLVERGDFVGGKQLWRKVER